MRVLVTRPEPEASDTAERLRWLGHQPLLAPMTVVTTDRAVAIETDGIAAVATTSRRAVEAVAERADKAAILQLPLYAVGDGTARTARRAGFTEVRSADGDVEALAGLVEACCDPADGAILYLAGRDRAGDLEGKLASVGFEVRCVEVYRADPVEALAAPIADALVAGAVDAVLIYSRRAAEILVSRLTELPVPPRLGHVAVLAISAAAAEPLVGRGFGPIRVADRKLAGGVLALLSSGS